MHDLQAHSFSSPSITVAFVVALTAHVATIMHITTILMTPFFGPITLIPSLNFSGFLLFSAFMQIGGSSCFFSLNWLGVIEG